MRDNSTPWPFAHTVMPSWPGTDGRCPGAPDVTGLIDLVTLPAVYRQAGHVMGPAKVLDPKSRTSTWRRAAARGADWTVHSLSGALRAFAAATGLESLHGLDQ